MEITISDDTFNRLGYSKEERARVRKKLADLQTGLQELAQKSKESDESVTQDFFDLFSVKNAHELMLPVGLEYMKLRGLAPKNIDDLVFGAGFRSTAIKQNLADGIKAERTLLEGLEDLNIHVESYAMAAMLQTPFARWSAEDIEERKNDPSVPAAEKEDMLAIWTSLQEFKEGSAQDLKGALKVIQKAIKSEVVKLYQACEGYLSIPEEAKKSGDITTEKLFFMDKAEAGNLLSLTSMLKQGALKDCASFQKLIEEEKDCLTITHKLGYILRDSRKRLSCATDLLDEVKTGEYKGRQVPQDPAKAPVTGRTTPAAPVVGGPVKS